MIRRLASAALVGASLALLPLPHASADDSTRPRVAALPSTALTAEGLPRVLSAGDVGRYREIFKLQKSGKWAAADKRIAALEDDRLMGHVLFQRYMHPTAYKSEYLELKRWMDAYADHPGAKRIYRLARKRQPANYKPPRKPVVAKNTVQKRPTFVQSEPYQSTKSLTKSQRRRANQIKRNVRRNVLRTRLTASEKLLNSAEARKLLDQVERDEAMAKVAAGWYYYGRPDKAHALADPAGRRSGADAPMTHWIAGLSAWRIGAIESAAWHFKHLAKSPRASSWTASAGAYWAARSYLRLREPQKVSQWLKVASRHQPTFYGLLARGALGMETQFDFRPHKLSANALAKIKKQAAGQRALALLQIGDRDRAEQELLQITGWQDQELADGLLALGERAKLPRLSFKLANHLGSSGHGKPGEDSIEAALYPIPHWEPDSGFSVDRALVYALMRQESGFNPNAKSPDGARGLMQLMPATAGYMAKKRYSGSKRNQLFDPGLNLELSQRYITYLIGHAKVQGDLFRLATAYNGGPGNLGKWQRKLKIEDDPLLFIESLPSRETRVFIERVLTNFWIYRARLDQPAPSLDHAASGQWPGYAALDGKASSRELARREQD